MRWREDNTLLVELDLVFKKIKKYSKYIAEIFKKYLKIFRKILKYNHPEIIPFDGEGRRVKVKSKTSLRKERLFSLKVSIYIYIFSVYNILRKTLSNIFLTNTFSFLFFHNTFITTHQIMMVHNNIIRMRRMNE